MTPPRATEESTPVVRYASAMILGLGAIFALHAASEILIPIALAVLIWFLINATADALRAAPLVGRHVGVALSKTVAALGFIALVFTVGRVMVDNMVRIGADLDPESSPLVAAALELTADLGLPVALDLETLSRFYPFETIVGAALSIIRNLIGDLSLVFLYVLFLLLDEPYFDAKLRALAPEPERRARLKGALVHIAAESRIYIWLMFILSAGVGGATFVICAAFGVQGAAFWGFLAFGLNFIPTIGSILAVAIPCFYALLTFSDPVALAALIGCLAATQFVAGEVAMPRLMGDHLNLSTFVVLLALVVWGALWGPVGMFLGIPITVIGVLICTRFPKTRFIAILLSRDGRISAPDSLAD